MRLLIAVAFLLLFAVSLRDVSAEPKGAKAIFHSGDGPTVLTGSGNRDSTQTVTDTDSMTGTETMAETDTVSEVPDDSGWTEEDEQALQDLLAEDDTVDDTASDDPSVSEDSANSETASVDTTPEDTAAQTASTQNTTTNTTTTRTNTTPTRVSSTRPAAATEKYMGISYWIEQLNPDGTTTRVSTNKTFRSGDRIKLNVESNRQGYLYVLNIGSTGNSHVLFPNPGVSSNLITAGLPYAVPFRKYMRFDNNPGEETLMMMLSPKPMESMMPAAPSYGPMDNQRTDQILQVASAKGAKDIILEDDVSGPAPATYVVAPVSTLDSKVITVQIKLRHR